MLPMHSFQIRILFLRVRSYIILYNGILDQNADKGDANTNRVLRIVQI